MAIDFPSSPTVGQTLTVGGATWQWDGAKWVAVGPSFAAASSILVRNRIVNGNFAVDQRRGGISLQIPPPTAAYCMDRWKITNPTAVAVMGSAGRSALNVTIQAQIGFEYGFAMTCSTAYASPAAGDQVSAQHTIEYVNIADAAFGNAAAKPLVLEFWAYAYVAGAYSVALQNAAATRSYVISFTIPVRLIWSKFRFSIPADTAGSWGVNDNNAAMILSFPACVGTTFTTSALNAWQDGNFVNATGSTNVFATSSSGLFLAGVGLLVNPPLNAEPEFRKFSDNLIDCSRYFQKIGGVTPGDICIKGNVIASGQLAWSFTFPQMRAAATATRVGTWTATNTGPITLQAGSNSINISCTPGAVGNVTIFTLDTTTYLTLDADF